MMRGVGGPLLCIGDLLSDVGGGGGGEAVASPPPQQHEPSPSSSSVSSSAQSLDLIKLYQLCSALQTANKLVQSTNSNVMLLSEKVGELAGVVKRADSAMAAARVVHGSLNRKEVPLDSNQNAK
ncbi:hypothetical protein ACFX1T_043788 [Malus domestica]